MKTGWNKVEGEITYQLKETQLVNVPIILKSREGMFIGKLKTMRTDKIRQMTMTKIEGKI